MQETRPASLSFFRSYEPAGFRFHNTIALAERVTDLPPIGSAESLASIAWFKSGTPQAQFVDLHNGAPAVHATTLRILVSNEGLFAAARMDEPAPQLMKRLVPADSATGEVKPHENLMGYAVDKDDHFALAIDPVHSHGDYFEFFLSNAGHASVHLKNFQYSESIHTTCDKCEPVKPAWEHRAIIAGDAWYAFMRIPWAALGLNALPEQHLIGMNATRLRAVEELRCSTFARVPFQHGMCAADFADLYLSPPPAVLESLDFGRPVLDQNTLKLSLKAATGASVTARATVTVGKDKRTISSDEAKTNIAAGSTATLNVPYRLDWQETGLHSMTLELLHDGRIFYSGQFVLGRNGYVSVTDRHEWDKPQPHPSPDDEQFMVKKRNYLLSRLPRMARTTTAQGAPSDFCLESADGKVRFNLMDPAVCRQIAAFIESRFDNDADRMAGASMFIHQKCFAMHCTELTHVHRHLSPESAMRLNGGHCYSRALSLAGVMREIRYTGQSRTYDARIMFVLGHVIVAVIDGGQRYLFDPTFGSFYYRHDNKAFATELEIAADLTLADRYGRGRRHNFSHPASHSLAPVGNVRWPAGAPVSAAR